MRSSTALSRALRPISQCTRTTQYHTQLHSKARPAQWQRAIPTRCGLRQARGITTYSTPTNRVREAIIKARQQNPVLLPILFIATLGAVSLLGLMAYDEYTRVAPEYSAYPVAVEQRLRTALHYTHVEKDPDAAQAYFLEALKAADGCGMDPFGKEFMGIRIRFAEMLEQFGRVKAAIEVLAGISHDCEQKVQELDQSSVGKEKLTGDHLSESDVTAQELRKSLLRGIIQAKVKASVLYESDYIQDPVQAKQTLSDAVGLLVKETRDPQVQGFSEDNNAGIGIAEIASILSQMGDLYATSGEEANAVQVYMLGLGPLRQACNGTRSCKEVQVLSNIASSMDIAMKKPGATINGKPANAESLKAARKAILAWADQAIATADRVLPENRDEICDLGVLSAQMTRADLLLESGDKARSRETFNSLLPKLRERGLHGLVTAAEQGLKRCG